MEPNARRPAHLHASSATPRLEPPHSRAAWRRHLHNEPPGLLRRLHLIPRRLPVLSSPVEIAVANEGGAV